MDRSSGAVHRDLRHLNGRGVGARQGRRAPSSRCTFGRGRSLRRICRRHRAPPCVRGLSGGKGDSPRRAAAPDDCFRIDGARNRGVDRLCGRPVAAHRGGGCTWPSPCGGERHGGSGGVDALLHRASLTGERQTGAVARSVGDRCPHQQPRRTAVVARSRIDPFHESRHFRVSYREAAPPCPFRSARHHGRPHPGAAHRRTVHHR